jgi:hypothetical protein
LYSRALNAVQFFKYAAQVFILWCRGGHHMIARGVGAKHFVHDLKGITNFPDESKDNRYHFQIKTVNS